MGTTKQVIFSSAKCICIVVHIVYSKKEKGAAHLIANNRIKIMESWNHALHRHHHRHHHPLHSCHYHREAPQRLHAAAQKCPSLCRGDRLPCLPTCLFVSTPSLHPNPLLPTDLWKFASTSGQKTAHALADEWAVNKHPPQKNTHTHAHAPPPPIIRIGIL